MKDFLIMGIVNITPDSFSDGGEFAEPEAAFAQCLNLIKQGADIVDIGAESSRPNATQISDDEEWRRLAPVLSRLLAANLNSKVSVDTQKPSTMERLAGNPVGWINNVSGSCPSSLLSKLIKSQPDLKIISMHMHGTPLTMQTNPLNGDDVIEHVGNFFSSEFDRLKKSGFPEHQIFLDPGIGFGKKDAANLKILEHVGSWSKRYNLLLGVSRKSFIGRLLDIPEPKARDGASKMLELGMVFQGAKIIRTHAVAQLANIRQHLRVVS